MIYPYAVAILTSFIFGFSFLFTKGALTYVTPYQLLALRFCMAALTMTLLRVLGIIKINIKNRPLGRLFLLALVQPVIYFICETTGVNVTTSTEAGLMIALIPVFVTIFAVFALKEIPHPFQIVFILTSVTGVGFIVLGGEKLSTSGHIFGLVALLGAVLAAAVFNILSRSLSKQFRPVELTFVMMWAGAICFSSLALFESFRQHGSVALLVLLKIKEVRAAVLYLGILSSVVAFFGINYYIAKLGSSRSAVFANLSTIVTVAAGICFRGEPFYWYHLVGGLLILLGVWGTNHFGSLQSGQHNSFHKVLLSDKIDDHTR